MSGTITWSWLWVLSPLWIGLVIGLVIVGGALFIGLLVAGILALLNTNKRY